MLRYAESVFRPNLFEGKVAIVTGGGSGIGKCIAHELRSLGCSVVIASRNLENLRASKREIDKNLCTPGELLEMKCNIRDDQEVEELVDKTIEKMKRIDFLVNNGGGQFPSPAENISRKGWNAVIDTNLTGTFRLSQMCYSKYMKENGGSIVNIIANMRNGFPGMSHTGAARAAVENLSKSLAIEWAPSCVRVNCVSPGIIWSSSAVANYTEGQSMFDMMAKRSPSQRLGTVEEVSAAVIYLLSPASAYTTATTVHVDGGMSIYGSPWDIPKHQSWKPYGGPPELLPSRFGNDYSKL